MFYLSLSLNNTHLNKYLIPGIHLIVYCKNILRGDKRSFSCKSLNVWSHGLSIMDIIFIKFSKTSSYVVNENCDICGNKIRTECANTWTWINY